MSGSSRSPLSPDDLARRVGRSGMRIRRLLRDLYPDRAPGSGTRWELTEAQVTEVLAYFNGRLPLGRRAGAKGASRPGAPAAVFRADGLPAEWYWEGHVQAALASYLKGQGWTIERASNTASREQGPDVSALRKGQRLFVEVKGYPSVGYRDPSRAGETKRTNPALQAKHWFSDALLKAIRMRNGMPTAEIAIGLPTADRYASLLRETEGALRLLGIGVLVVDQAGEVTVEIEPHRASSIRLSLDR